MTSTGHSPLPQLSTIPAARPPDAAPEITLVTPPTHDSERPSTTPQPRSAATHRIRGLDGLRGLGAVAIVLSHCLHIAPGLATINDPEGARPGDPWWLARTPLHLLWAGTESIYILFLASGLVLALPLMGREASLRAWFTYYPRRLARLYIPVAASVVLALALYSLRPWQEHEGYSWWLNGHAEPVTVRGLVADVTLLTGNTWLNSPLWSTRITILFALALPVYVIAARVLRRRSSLAVAGLTVLSVLSVLVGSQTAQLLTVFGFGVLLAYHLPAVHDLGSRLAGWHWVVVGVLSVALLQVRWLWPHPVVWPVTTLAGAVLIVFMVLANPFSISVTERRWPQFLGKISFSLYLVHAPIVVSVANLVAGTSVTRTVIVTTLLALPLSILCAWAFMKWVEAPSHRAARALGRTSGQLYDAATASAVQLRASLAGRRRA